MDEVLIGRELDQHGPAQRPVAFSPGRANGTTLGASLRPPCGLPKVTMLLIVYWAE